MFENNYLKINEYGIFIKSLYKNIAFYEINRIELVKGHVIKNWKFSFILGLVMTIVFPFQIVKITPYIDPTTTLNVQFQMMVYISLYIFLFCGLYLLYVSLSKKPVIRIFTEDNHMYLYPLSTNKNQLSHIVIYLSTCDVTLINMLCN